MQPAPPAASVPTPRTVPAIAADLAELVRLGHALRAETDAIEVEQAAFWRACQHRARAKPVCPDAARPDAPCAYAPGAAPAVLAEALAVAWRLQASLFAIARAADPGPERAGGERAAETYRLALLPLDALLAPHRLAPEPAAAARARDRLTLLIAQGRRLERRFCQRRRAAWFAPHPPIEDAA